MGIRAMVLDVLRASTFFYEVGTVFSYQIFLQKRFHALEHGCSPSRLGASADLTENVKKNFNVIRVMELSV